MSSFTTSPKGAPFCIAGVMIGQVLQVIVRNGIGSRQHEVTSVVAERCAQRSDVAGLEHHAR
jgi:hypothetical protein